MCVYLRAVRDNRNKCVEQSSVFTGKDSVYDFIYPFLLSNREKNKSVPHSLINNSRLKHVPDTIYLIHAYLIQQLIFRTEGERFYNFSLIMLLS